MTPQEFLQQFGTLAESPQGVPKLRELILELAVRGKLVEQGTSKSTRPLNEFDETFLDERRRQKGLLAPPAPEEFGPIPETWDLLRLGLIMSQISN